MVEDQQEFLEDFIKWQSEKKINGTDLSPQAFLIDRAKEQALSTLIDIVGAIEDLKAGRLDEHRFTLYVIERIEDSD